METAKELADNLITRAKNMQEFVVEQPARIFVHAMTQQEAERQVDDWFGEGVE